MGVNGILDGADTTVPVTGAFGAGFSVTAGWIVVVIPRSKPARSDNVLDSTGFASTVLGFWVPAAPAESELFELTAFAVSVAVEPDGALPVSRFNGPALLSCELFELFPAALVVPLGPPLMATGLMGLLPELLLLAPLVGPVCLVFAAGAGRGLAAGFLVTVVGVFCGVFCSDALGRALLLLAFAVAVFRAEEGRDDVAAFGVVGREVFPCWSVLDGDLGLFFAAEGGRELLRSRSVFWLSGVAGKSGSRSLGGRHRRGDFCLKYWWPFRRP